MDKSHTKFILSDKKKKENFIYIFQLLKCSSSQINLTMNVDDLHIQGMDKSHVCLFDLLLHREWFNEYSVDKTCQVCFDVNTFCSIISTKNEDQNMCFYLDDQNNDIAYIQFINDDKKLAQSSEYNKFFKLPLLEYEYEEMNIPASDYDVEITLPSKKISDVFSQLSNFGDDLYIKCCDEWVEFESSRDSIEMCVRILVDSKDVSSYSIAIDEQGDDFIKLSYSLIYVNKMCVTNKLSNEIQFNLSSEFPMKIYYDLGNKSSLYFYIAPKVTDD